MRNTDGVVNSGVLQPPQPVYIAFSYDYARNAAPYYGLCTETHAALDMLQVGALVSANVRAVPAKGMCGVWQNRRKKSMSALCAVLLSWAASLSGYAEPSTCPQIVNVDAAFMERKVGTRSAFGWYPGEKDVVYIDFARLKKYSNTYRNSVIVHELTHWLQHENGEIGINSSCHDFLLAEREAYGVQLAFVTAYGNPTPVGIASMTMMCPGE